MIRQRIFITGILLGLMCSVAVSAQTIRLLADVNPGAEDSQPVFSLERENVAQLGSSFITSVRTADLGLEVARLDADGVEVLLDIAPGPGDANPSYFTAFGDHVYFQVNGTGVPGNGPQLYRTDGTFAGTTVAFDVPNRGSSVFSEPFVSRGGYMYFTHADVLYRTADGTRFDTIFIGVTLAEFTALPSERPRYSRYKDEIAFVDVNNSAFTLYAVQGDSARALASVATQNRFTRFQGIAELDGGIVLSASSASDPSIDGLYLYRESVDTFTQFRVNGQSPNHARALPGGGFLADISEEGYFFISDTIPSLVRIADDQNSFGFALGQRPLAGTSASFGLLSNFASFNDFNLVVSDGTTAGSRIALTEGSAETFVNESDSTYFFLHLKDDFFDGDSLHLYRLNLASAGLERVYSLNEAFDFRDGFGRVFGVLGDTVFLYAEVNDSIGYEPYVLVLDEPSSTAAASLGTLSVITTGDTYTVLSETDEPIDIALVNVDGRILGQERSRPGETHKFPPGSKGVVILQIQRGAAVRSFRVLRP